MKKWLLCLLGVLIFGPAVALSAERTFERPTTGLRNTRTLEIDKVVVDDDRTAIYFDAYFHPNQWIRIASDTYIQADGNKYLITGADSIELDSHHHMPASGEYSFILYFPPLPAGTERFDFIEGDCDDCFKIWDVDLVGNFVPGGQYLEGLDKIDQPHTLREPELNIARTTVQVNIYGIKDGFALEVPRMLVRTFLKSSGDDEIVAVKTDDGQYQFEFDQFGTTTALLIFAGQYKSILLAPGDNVSVFLDVEGQMARLSRYNNLPPQKTLLFTGAYGRVNSEMGEFNIYDLGMPDPYRMFSDTTVWKMSDAEYLQRVKEEYLENGQILGQLPISDAFKSVYAQAVKTTAAQAVLGKARVKGSSQRQATGEYPELLTRSPLSQQELAFLTELELNNKKLLLSSEFAYLAFFLKDDSVSDADVKAIAGAETGLLPDLKKVLDPLFKAETEEGATEQELALMRGASTPFYIESYEKIRQNTLAMLEKARSEGGFTILDAPDVAAEEILEAIVARHPGKVVFVDFWATWCGPCIQAMKTIKPFKPEMESNGVVTIYLTGTSSPQTKWMTMLPEIGGTHYYLTAEQWQAVTERYEVQGIPTYLIYDKTGTQVYKSTGFPGVEKLKSEFEKYW